MIFTPHTCVLISRYSIRCRLCCGFSYPPMLCRYQSKTKCVALLHGCPMLWLYFGFGHGKEVHDGARAILKQEIRKQQMTMTFDVKL
jgi:hypothetical protein